MATSVTMDERTKDRLERLQAEINLETFERYDDRSLSFTDANTIALVDAYDIDAVLGFDDDFDGLVERVDPASL